MQSTNSKVVQAEKKISSTISATQTFDRVKTLKKVGKSLEDEVTEL